jgi:hypothetical protein
MGLLDKVLPARKKRREDAREKERVLRANDRVYNDQFKYAVSWKIALK